MNDYERVARIIRHLDQHFIDQPSLGELATAAGMSESHFHRLFRRWAGITPKDFLQCLTAAHAKARLRESETVLASALDAGLSGPGRLHDLLVAIEAASPGELKSGGSGMTIEWGVTESPFGKCSLGWNSRGICHLAFQDAPECADVPPELRSDWPNAAFRRNDPAARRKGKAIFSGGQDGASAIRAFVRGTPFQVKVWQALLRIPEGCVASYRRVARATGDEQAARAVGSACAVNPIAYLIPCHRVIRETGVVKGYRWGDTRKRAILARESPRAVPSPGKRIG